MAVAVVFAAHVPGPGGTSTANIPKLVENIDGIDQKRVFKGGEHIACVRYDSILAGSRDGGV